MEISPLLSRDEFRRQVLARLGGRCAFCSSPAVDAHHILDRKLFADGGYRLSNGAPVCERHHWDCEITRRSVPEVWAACGISPGCLPEGFDPRLAYDKWGNRIRPDGTRAWGPLQDDSGARKALAMGGVLGLFRPDEDDEVLA